MAAKNDFFCEHISAFSQSIRSSSSPQAWQAPPQKHCVSRVTGGLEEIYTKLQSGWQNVEEEDYSKCISSDGFFQPHSKVGLLAGRYQVVHVLGRGNSSTIVQAHDTFRPGHFEVAIKILKPEYFALGYQESHLILELNKADSHNICGIVKLLNTFKLGPFFCMTFELMQPRPLHHVFKKITDGKEKLAMIRKVAVRMLQILGFLGHQNVIHADLKPENILCPSENLSGGVKVIDFGNALHCVYEELSLYYDEFELQTLLYRAPEVVLGLGVGHEIDMWSLGCILAELYMGKPLFWAKEKAELLTQMTSLLGPLPTKVYQRAKFFTRYKEFVGQPSLFMANHSKLSSRLGCMDFKFVTFVLALLNFDPGDRLSVQHAIQHPFLAPELAIKFLLPIKSNSTEPSTMYSPVDITPSMYDHVPAGAGDSKHKHLTSLEFLRHGTVGSAIKPKVVHVVAPMEPCGQETADTKVQPKQEPEAVRTAPAPTPGNRERPEATLSVMGTSSSSVNTSSIQTNSVQNQGTIIKSSPKPTPGQREVAPAAAGATQGSGGSTSLSSSAENSNRDVRLPSAATVGVSQQFRKGVSSVKKKAFQHVGKRKRYLLSFQKKKKLVHHQSQTKSEASVGLNKVATRQPNSGQDLGIKPDLGTQEREDGGLKGLPDSATSNVAPTRNKRQQHIPKSLKPTNATQSISNVKTEMTDVKQEDSPARTTVTLTPKSVRRRQEKSGAAGGRGNAPSQVAETSSMPITEEETAGKKRRGPIPRGARTGQCTASPGEKDVRGQTFTYLQREKQRVVSRVDRSLGLNVTVNPKSTRGRSKRQTGASHSRQTKREKPAAVTPGQSTTSLVQESKEGSRQELMHREVKISDPQSSKIQFDLSIFDLSPSPCQSAHAAGSRKRGSLDLETRAKKKSRLKRESDVSGDRAGLVASAGIVPLSAPSSSLLLSSTTTTATRERCKSQKVLPDNHPQIPSATSPVAHQTVHPKPLLSASPVSPAGGLPSGKQDDGGHNAAKFAAPLQHAGRTYSKPILESKRVLLALSQKQSTSSQPLPPSSPDSASATLKNIFAKAVPMSPPCTAPSPSSLGIQTTMQSSHSTKRPSPANQIKKFLAKSSPRLSSPKQHKERPNDQRREGIHIIERDIRRDDQSDDQSDDHSDDQDEVLLL